MHRVAALDLATTTGWAIDHPDDAGRPQYGSLKLPGESLDYGSKGAHLEQWLEQQIAHRRPNYIVFEQPSDPRFYNARTESCPDCNCQRVVEDARRTNFAAIRLTIGLALLVETIAKRHGIDCMEVPVQSWRSFFTGTTRGGKEPAYRRCLQLGWHVDGFDESDAIGVWAFFKARLDPKWSFSVGSTPLFGARKP